MLDFARPKLRLCATHVATLRDPCCDFSRPMLRLCATHVATLRDPCCDFARPMLRLCATHVATMRDPCCDFSRPMLRLCATHVATLSDPYCDFARPMLRLCGTHVANLRDPFLAMLRLLKPLAVYFGLWPCVGLLVAVLCIVSKYVHLLKCTLTIHIFWIILQSASVLRLWKQTNIWQQFHYFSCSKLFISAAHFETLREACCNFARPMLRPCATHVATLRDPCCDFARPMLRLCATHVATLCDPFLAMLRLFATEASCGSMEFRSQKVHFGDRFRSQHERRPRRGKHQNYCR